MSDPVDGIAAANTLASWGTCDPGYCLHYVWQAYKAHGARSNGSYPTAYSAWLASPGKHEGDWNPPAGVPVYFGPKASSQAGDVVISTGGGQCVATDWPRNGVIGRCSLAQRQAQISRPYLGWTDNILGYPIAQVAGPPPVIPIDEESGMWVIAANDDNKGEFALVNGIGWRQLEYGDNGAAQLRALRKIIAQQDPTVTPKDAVLSGQEYVMAASILAWQNQVPDIPEPGSQRDPGNAPE